METVIYNNDLKAVIKHKGAELFSLEKNGKNYIWSIDENYWNKTSPILFPIVGGLKNNQYEYKGNIYDLPRHGFARDFDFELISKSEDSVTFSLMYFEKTLKVYPFLFELQISYILDSDTLNIKYTVINHSSEEMYFSIGAHPAFSINGELSNYSLQFDNNHHLTTYKLEDNLFSGKTENITIENYLLALDYKLFENDAIVLKNSVTSSLMLLKNDVPEMKVSFPEFPYLGIWTKSEAPFLCIEPWLGIADNYNASGKIEEKEGICLLNGNESFSASWNIKIF